MLEVSLRFDVRVRHYGLRCERYHRGSGSPGGKGMSQRRRGRNSCPGFVWTNASEGKLLGHEICGMRVQGLVGIRLRHYILRRVARGERKQERSWTLDGADARATSVGVKLVRMGGDRALQLIQPSTIRRQLPVTCGVWIWCEMRGTRTSSRDPAGITPAKKVTYALTERGR